MTHRTKLHISALVSGLALIAVACGSGDSDAAEDTVASTEASATTQEEATTTEAESTTTGTEDTTTTTSTTEETEPAVELAGGGLFVTEVVFGDHVTITNSGEEAMSLDGLWLCNRPSYIPLSGELAPGESLDFSAGSLGGLAADGGEVGIYLSDSFGSSDDIVNYVSWAGGGGRGSVATEAGIWPADGTVEVTGDSIALDGDPTDPASWANN